MTHTTSPSSSSASALTLTTRSPLRYPGGKFRARKIIADRIPEDAVHIMSPFLGGGSVELYLTGLGKTVTAFDGFGVLANFWEALLSSPEELADRANRYMGQMTSNAFNSMKDDLCSWASTDVDVQSAALFFVVNRCSFSGTTLSGGFSKASAETRFTPSSVDRIRTFHNTSLTVDQKMFPESLSGAVADFLFLDPPYMLDDRSRLYGVGGDLHKVFDHDLLREMVGSMDIPFLLTYNDCEGVRKMWDGYRIETAEWSYGMNSSKKSSEVIITNF